MKLFQNYLDGIKSIVDDTYPIQSRAFSSYSDMDSVLPQYFEKGLNEAVSLSTNTDNKVLINFDSNQLKQLFGPNKYTFPSTTIGNHPDFKSLEHHEYENHFSVSMFMDIKGSTRLVERFPLLQVRKIKDTVLTLAVHIASHFGGHIHRMQGDAVFVQFVRKSQKEQDAVINALNAASVLAHFISTDLAELFKQIELNPLKVRVGIDYGKADDVIWSYYGIPGCSELTTTSLHTDLAAKLQAQANPNGILIGGNIRDILDIKPEFCEDLLKENGDKDYYIYEGVKNYRKFNFNWTKYLLSFDFIKRSSSYNTLEFEVPLKRIVCTIAKPDNSIEELYYPNATAIPKGSSIKFTLQEQGKDYHKKNFETIEWTAFNSGKEAKDNRQEVHDFAREYNNQTICVTSAAYTGHHYVECKIKTQHSGNTRITFPIFVE